jgi:hypothetical protein
MGNKYRQVAIKWKNNFIIIGFALYKDKLGNNQVQNTLINPPIDYLPTSAIYASGAPIILGYLYSTLECTDCTLRGTTQAPPWWQ